MKRHRPELHPVLGDVRNLPLEDDSVDGYWSLGVIEHLYDGYGDIFREMYRVIRRDGYLFLTFSHMERLELGKDSYASCKSKIHDEFLIRHDICKEEWLMLAKVIIANGGHGYLARHFIWLYLKSGGNFISSIIPYMLSFFGKKITTVVFNTKKNIINGFHIKKVSK